MSRTIVLKNVAINQKELREYNADTTETKPSYETSTKIIFRPFKARRK